MLAVRYEPLLLVEGGIALPPRHALTADLLDKVGCCPLTLLAAHDSMFPAPHLPLFLIQPYGSVLYTLVLLTSLGLKLNPLPPYQLVILSERTGISAVLLQRDAHS